MGRSAHVGGEGGLVMVSADAGAGRAKTSRSVEKPHIFLIDQRTLTRESVLNLLTTTAREFSVSPLSSADELAEVALPNASLVVLSIGFAPLTDVWVKDQIRLLRDRLADIPLILLSESDDLDQVMEALRCGVRGYIPTSFSPRVAVEAIRLVFAGGTFIPASALKQPCGEHGQADPLVSDPTRVTAPSDPETGAHGVSGEPVRDLTPRQRQVLRLLCEGQPNKIIAHALSMQEGTVKVHVRQIMKKLKATNRTQVAFFANRLRTLDEGDA